MLKLTTVLFVLVQAQTIAAQSDKRQRQFDKSIDEWKRKVADLQVSVVLVSNIFPAVTLVIVVQDVLVLVCSLLNVSTTT